MAASTVTSANPRPARSILGLVRMFCLLMVGSLTATGPLHTSPQTVQGPGGSSMEESCRREVEELHKFFEDWFNARLPAAESAFRRFESVMGDRFMIISPSGERTERTELVRRLWEAHGIWRANARPGRIWIENLQVRYQVGQQAMVIYEEWQEIEGETRGRLSTAVLQQRSGTPNGVEWIHVHEVWLPE